MATARPLIPARLHRFQLIARKETYRLAVRAPEWIARAFRARNRPWIDRGQRSDPKRRPGFRVRDERDVSAVGRHGEFDSSRVKREPSGGRIGNSTSSGVRQRHITTVEQHRSTQRQSEGGGNNPAEPSRPRADVAALHQPRMVDAIGLLPSSSSMSASAMSCSRLRGSFRRQRSSRVRMTRASRRAAQPNRARVPEC